MPRLLVMVGNDLRQQALDRSIFIFGLAVPLVLMWVFSLVFSPLVDDLEPTTVALGSAEEGQLVTAIAQTLTELERDGLQVSVVRAFPQEVPELVNQGEVIAGVVVPASFDADLAAGRAPDLTLSVGAQAGVEADVVASVVQASLRQATANARIAEAATALGTPPELLQGLLQADAASGPTVRWSSGRVADHQLNSQEAIIGGQAGFFLFFTVGFGVLGLVVEREWGTLSRLQTMPIPRWWVPLSKGVSSWLLGVVATGVLLTAGSLFFEVVDFGSPPVILVLLLSVVAAATSIMFVIAKVARTAEQAGLAQSLVAITLGMSGGSFFRVSAEGVLGRVLQINPVTALTQGLGITAGGGGVADVLPVLATMAIFTTVMLVLAFTVPGRRDLG